MRRPRPTLRSFARDSRGATAVEFALGAGPFFLMMFALFENALLYLVTVSLDSAPAQGARPIRTGEAQKAQMTAAQFKSQVCANMGWLQTQCPSNLYVDARTFGTFGGSASPQPNSGGRFDQTQLRFEVGGPGAIVLVTTFYQWTLLTPALQTAFSTMTGGIDVVSARTAFRNEPYTSG